VTVPSVDSSRATKLLPLTLSLVAGSTDIIGFLGLDGLFTAHITGNLAIMAAHIVTGGAARLAEILSLPVFVAVLALARLIAAELEALRLRQLPPLLLLQLLLLAGFLTLSVAAGTPLDPNAATAIVAGMLGVAAMAVQNALVQVALAGAPSTAVMTTNVTRFVGDLGTIALARDRRDIAATRHRAWYGGQAIVGFAAGCALGAAGYRAVAMWSLLLPTGGALLAVVLGLLARGDAPAEPPRPA
jgi:uncharacterized membrane protein YoaK (UPF0700 family)